MKFETYTLGSLCHRVTSGGTPKSTVPEYYNGSIPWLNTKEINFNRIVTTERTISQLGLESSSAKWINAPAVIVAMYGATAGKIAVAMRPLTTNQACCNMEIREDKADFRYVYYYLKWKYPDLSSLANGGAQQNLNAQVIKEFPIQIPPIDVQKMISDILWKIDNKIELNQRINENLERQARTIYHKWLADNSGKFELHLLSEIAIINPDTYSPKESWEYFNYLDTSSITNGDISEIQHFTQTEKLPSRARRKVINGDIVFSTVRPNQKHFGMIFSALPNMLVSTGFAVIRSTLKCVCNELIYLQITEDAFIEKMQQLAEQSTSTFPSIKPSDLGNYLVSCPSEQDGLELSKQLKAIFTLAAIKREENEKLSALRDILLPKLMSGEIDVSNIRL